MFSLSNKVAIVTGATSGLGKSAAFHLAAQGAKVVVSGRRVEAGNAVVDEIKAKGGEATFIQADVTREADVEALFSSALETYGKIDIALLNSGVFRFSPLESQDRADLADQINVNVQGVFYGVKQAAKWLQPGASVIIVSSAVAEIGMPTTGAYSLTKGAVNTLTRVAAIELAPKGIRVNAVAPGPIATEGAAVVAGGAENFDSNFRSFVPLGRVGQPEEVSAAVVFLASDESSYVTGQILGVDGGVGAK